MNRWHIVVLGNYGPDDQPSMLRYAESLAEGLHSGGHLVERLSPMPVLLGSRCSTRGLGKWLGYVDKYLIFPWILSIRLYRAKRLSETVLLHIADHSNALYGFFSGLVPVVVTCHDVGAIKGARGLLADCPATLFGKLLQKWIGAGLRRADAVACVSEFTAGELRSLVMNGKEGKVAVVPNGFNRRFDKLTENRAREVVERLLPCPKGERYILHVGSGLRRKNRAVVLKVLAKVRKELNLRLVIAGEPLNDELWTLARDLQIESYVVEVERPDDHELEALYRCAEVFLFPSRFEGFGWPIIEAQACGCPVLAANNSAQPEVVGKGGWIRDSENVEGYVSDLYRLQNADVRQRLIQDGFENAKRFSMDKVVEAMETIYARLA